MSDAKFQAPSSHKPEKGRVSVKIGEKLPVLDVEFNEMQEIQNHLRAELVRAGVHSGVVDYVPGVRTNGNTELSGEIATWAGGTWINKLVMGEKSNLLINGYKLAIEGYNNRQIILPTPPTYGTRDDLVFLEAWFENVDSVKDPTIIDSRLGVETNRRVELKWRIRTVAGVDFSKFPEGFSKMPFLGLEHMSTTVVPQGSNSEPLASNPINDWMNTIFRPAVYGVGTSSGGSFNTDLGLYVTGQGAQTSKDRLKTADGYVYAIPLFRVKRRNSGGYRADNLNGAREYVGDLMFSCTSGNSYLTIKSTSLTDLKKWRSGDVLKFGSMAPNYPVITSIDYVTGRVDVDKPLNATHVDAGLSLTVYVNEHRPDGLFANIIDKNDIIDLRHRVSLTGENFDKLLQESFDKYMRTELRPKPEEMVKNRYGLKRAPLGLKQELVPVKLKGADNVDRELINLLEIGGQALAGKNYLAYAPNSKVGVSLDGTYTYGTTKFQGAKTVGAVLMADFVGKVTMSVVENPHKHMNNWERTSTSLLVPSSTNWAEGTTAETYARVQALDTTSISTSRNSASGGMGQQLFSFNLIEHIERTYGTIPKTTVADKVQWIKDNVAALKVHWHGFGSSPTGSKANFKVWNGSWFGTTEHTNATVTKISRFDSLSSTLQSDGFVHYLAYADPSNGTIASTINTDYINLEVELKPTANLKSTKGTIVYEISQADYDKVNVDAEFTGDKLLTKFPYVDVYPNFIENLLPNGLNDWEAGSINLPDGQLITHSDNLRLVNHLPVLPSTKYYLNGLMPYASYVSYIYFYDSAKTFISSATMPNGTSNVIREFTSPSNCAYIKVVVQSVSYNKSHIQGLTLTKSPILNVSIPYGRWYLPNDYATSKTLTKIGEQFNSARRTFSDAQTSEAVTMVVDPASPKADKHITVTQATADRWTANDTIKIKSDYGVVSGVIDSDTALAKATSALVNGTITVDDVSKLVVGDKVSLWRTDLNTFNAMDITAIDTTTKTLTFNNTFNDANSQSIVFVETTASSSSPVTSATGLAGTWSNLGTKEATFTITTAPTTNTEEIEFKYSVNYPAGKGLEYLPSEVLEANVNGQKLVKGTTISVKANFEGKVAGNNDLVPHMAKRGEATSLMLPTQFGAEDATAVTNIQKLDLIWSTKSTTLNGYYAQSLFSLNVIRAIEDKYGEIPTKGTAGKVQWVKDNITKLTANWHGFGSNAHATPIQKDDFTGKVSGSVVENPHLAKRGTHTGLIPSPSFAALNETADSMYTNISTLNGVIQTSGGNATTSGNVGQFLFSFDLIKMVERKYGTAVPGATTADKVQWLKDNITKITANWHGFGSSVGGNKANLHIWRPDNLIWALVRSHTSGTVTKLFLNNLDISATDGVSKMIGSDGFMHVLANAEPSDGVTASTINTDYIDIELELKGSSKATFAQWYVQGSTWGTTTTHSTNGVFKLQSTRANPGIDRIDDNGFVYYLAYAEPSNGVAPSTINTDYIEWEIELNVAETGYTVMQPENTFPVLSDSPLLHKQGENLLPPFTEYAIPDNMDVESPYRLKVNSLANNKFAVVKVRVMPNTTYTYSAKTESNFTNYRLRSLDLADVQVDTTGYYSANSKRTFTTLPNAHYVEFGFYDDTDPVPSYVTEPQLELGSVATPFKQGTPKRSIRKSKMDFFGKVAGSTVENPHRFLRANDTIFKAPSDVGYVENNAVDYSNVTKQDGALYGYSNSTATRYAMSLFEFDLSHLGLSLKELKSALRKLTTSWTGYGKGDNAGVLTYGATIRIWNNETGVWDNLSTSNTSNAPQTGNHTLTVDLGKRVSKDQKLYILVFSTYPASATISSEIFTDYVKLEVELADYVDYVKGNIVKVRPETKEAKLHFPAKSNRYVGQGVNEDVVELYYKHVPIADKVVANDMVTVLGEIPEFLVSDLSTSVGHKQGTHHYMNPLYRVGNDRVECFGDFGFGGTPFAVDSKGINTGSKVTIQPYGFSNNYSTQYGLSTIKKPMVGVARYLVLHNSELKMLLVSRYTATGTNLQSGGASDSVALLVPIEGKPLVKQAEGVVRAMMASPKAWKTSTGEILGYLREDGTVIATYQ
jgi:hypothetical protein